MTKVYRGVALIFFLVLTVWIVIFVIEYDEPSQWDADQQANDQTHIKAVEILSSERMAYYTNVLAIFTGLLGVFGFLQIVFLIQANRTAEAAAEAAKTSADAAQSTVVSMNEINRREMRAYISGNISIAENRQLIVLTVNNGGKTPGEITKIGMNYSEPGNEPEHPNYQYIPLVAWIHPNMFGQKLQSIAVINFFGAPALPSGALTVFGRLHYLDVFRVERYFSFCISVDADDNIYITQDAPRNLILWT